MDWPDLVILGVVGLSILVGGLRGFIKEALSLAVWAAAFLIAFQYSGAVAEHLGTAISLPSARTAIAFGGLFLVVVTLGALLTYLIGKLVEKSGLSGTDRLLGAVFGAARGVMLVLVMILVAGFTPIPNDPWWQESQGVQAMLPLAEWAAEFLPESFIEHLDLYPEPVEVQADA